ncbi:KR domain-containing protein [Aspergillus venezuelensis]
MPSSASQQQLIENTYARTGLDPRSLEQCCQYFEAHGTDTLAGDPQEGPAIYHAFFGKEPLPMECISNSAPTNRFGNGGITNDNGERSDTLLVSPKLLFKKVNPALEPFASRLRAATELTPWPDLAQGVPRRVLVNLFWFGGTNAHVILEYYDAHPEHNGTSQKLLSVPSPAEELPTILSFVFSTAAEQSLVAVLKGYAQDLREAPPSDLVDLAYVLFRHRLALKLRHNLWAPDMESLISRLQDEATAVQTKKSTRVSKTRRTSDKPLRIMGIFTGQHRESVIHVYRSIQQLHPPSPRPAVGGVANGVLTLDDHLFNTLTLESMQTTHGTKVTGSLILNELSGPTVDLDFFILFGSLTGVVGNFKQTAYSSASEFQPSLIHGRRARGLVGSIVHPGIVTGVGYMTRQGERWVNHVRKTTGSLLLSESDLHKLFAEAILAGRPHPSSSARAQPLINPELVVGVQLNDPDENPDTFWYPNSMGWNYVDYRLKKSQAQSGPLGSNAPSSLKLLLHEASTLDEVVSIICTGLVAKVRSKLYIADDIEITTSTQPSELDIMQDAEVEFWRWYENGLVKFFVWATHVSKVWLNVVRPD